MAGYSFKINGLDQLINDSKRAGSIAQSLLRDAMYKATTVVKNEAKSIRPGSFKNQTGTLRRSIQNRVIGPEKGIVFTDELYGAYVEYGTKAHKIVARNAKVLADKKRNIIFGKVVNHPGSKPYPYMKPALDDSIDDIEKIYLSVADKIVSVLAGK